MTTQGDIDYFKNPVVEACALKAPFGNGRDGLSHTLMNFGGILYLLPNLPAKVLELGCGAGWLSRFLAIGNYNVVGVDISKEAIEIANLAKRKEQLKDEQLKYLLSDYENLNYDSEFDVVIFFASLHHATDEKQAIKTAYNALKNGGVLITFEPGMGHEEHPNTKKEIEKFGVTEKDMPPSYIIKMGQEIGFKNYKFYPQVMLLNNPKSIITTKQKRKLKNLFGLISTKYNTIYNYQVTYSLDSSGIVVLTK